MSCAIFLDKFGWWKRGTKCKAGVAVHTHDAVKMPWVGHAVMVVVDDAPYSNGAGVLEEYRRLMLGDPRLSILSAN
jgi:hypothetical protein